MLEPYGLRLRISWLMRQLKGKTFQSSAMTWGLEENDQFRVAYQLDMRPDSKYEPELKVSYKIEDKGQSKQISYSIYLTETRCNLGGIRYWFTCPLSRNNENVCGRRIGVLRFNGKYFGCRQCVGYTYQTKSINYTANKQLRMFDLQLRAQNLEERMKRYTWRGKETRQMRQLRKLYERLGYPQYADMLLHMRSRMPKVVA